MKISDKQNEHAVANWPHTQKKGLHDTEERMSHKIQMGKVDQKQDHHK